MSAARWSLRLPKTTSSLLVAVESRTVTTVTRQQQRRWSRKPAPPRDGSKALRSRTTPDNGNDERESEAARAVQEESRVKRPQPQPEQAQDTPPEVNPSIPGPNTQLATALAESDSSNLVTEVRLPDDSHGVLLPDHPALAILGNSSLVIQRQLEMMNVIMGFEQANRYIIMDGQGQTIGYIAERDHGFGSAMARQLARTHRSFTTYIFDRHEREVLRIHRPFAWINSRIRIYDPVPGGGYGEMATSTDLQGVSAGSAANPRQAAQVSPLKLEEMRIIGEAQQQWAPLRRKYNLFSHRPVEPVKDDDTPRLRAGGGSDSDTEALVVTESGTNDAAIEAGMVQFAHVNEPFLSWDFTLRGEDQSTIGSVNRNFGGFAREIFTDTGVYVLRMDSVAQSSSLENVSGKEIARYEREAAAMTLDQRAVMLATAVSIDFDYFSRHSHSGGGFMPMWLPMGGGAAEGGAAAGGAAEAGAIGGAGAIEGAAGAVGRGAAGVAGAGASEGAVAGVGGMAGYEAMQRGVYGPRAGDDASPQANESFDPSGQPPQQGGQQGDQDVWGESGDPWAGQNQDPWGGGNESPGPSNSGSGGDGGGSGGWLDSISDFFSD